MNQRKKPVICNIKFKISAKENSSDDKGKLQAKIIIIYKIYRKKFIKIYKDIHKDFTFFIFYIIHIFLKINMHYISHCISH